MTQEHAVYDSLSVYSIAQCFRQLSVVLPDIVVEIIHYASVIGGLHLIYSKSILVLEFGFCLRCYLRKIDLTGFQLQCSGIGIFYDLEYHFADLRGTTIVVIELLHGYALTHIPAYQFVRSCSHWRLVEAVLGHILSFKQMCRQYTYGQIVQHCYVRCCELDIHMCIVYHLYTFDIFEI